MSPSKCVSNKTPDHEEVVPETPQDEQLHGSPPYTVFRRVATGLPKLEMLEVRYTKPVPGEKPVSFSPIRLPNGSSPYLPSTSPADTSLWVYSPSGVRSPPKVQPEVSPRTPKGEQNSASSDDEERPILRWGSPAEHMQRPPRRSLRQKRPASPSSPRGRVEPKRLLSTPSPCRGRASTPSPSPQPKRRCMKQASADSTQRAPPLNFFVVGRRALTSSASTLLSELVCRENMP